MAIDLYSKASVDTLLAAKLDDAPSDGTTYGRKDGAWVTVGGGGSPSSDFMMATAIASLIYSQSSNSYGYLSVGNVPQYIIGLGTSWGIMDGSSTYYNCTGFTGSFYSLSGTLGSGPYYVQVNGTSSGFSF